MNRKVITTSALSALLLIGGCGQEQNEEIKSASEQPKKGEETQENKAPHELDNRSEKVKELQAKYLPSIRDIQKEVFTDDEFQDHGSLYLDNDLERIVVGLVEGSKKGQEFKNLVEERLPNDVVKWKTVKYPQNVLNNKYSVVWRDIEAFGLDSRNNFGISNQTEKNRLLVEIDSITEEQREKLKNKFGDIIHIKVDGEMKELTEKANQQTIETKDVSMRTKKETYPVNINTFSIIIKNDSQADLSYGSPYSIQKRVEGTWYEIPFDMNTGFNSIGLSLQSGGTNTEEISINRLDYELTPGLYRVVKSFDPSEGNDYNPENYVKVAAEFELVKEK